LQARNRKILDRDRLEIRFADRQPADEQAANRERAYRKCTDRKGAQEPV